MEPILEWKPQVIVGETPVSSHSIEVQAGFSNLPDTSLSGSIPFTGGYLGYSRRFFKVKLGLWGSHADYPSSPRSYQFLLEARIEGGYQHQWSFFDLFVGGHATGSLLIQRLTNAIPVAPVFGLGFTTTLGFWVSPSWGVTVSGDLGFLVVSQGNEWKTPPNGALRLGVVFRIGG